jgi:tRNA(fMet)-specific endonuclease VapC
VLPLDKESSLLAGRIHGDLLRTGQTIGRADPLIAAITISQDLTLVTGNTEHFQRIIDLGYPLRLDSWRL